MQVRTNVFCGAAARASGYYVVAAAIAVPVTRVPPGMIDYFQMSMPKFFAKDSGILLTRQDFQLKQIELQFSIV